MQIITGILVVVAIFVGISMVWRLLSEKTSLPCPSWLAWMLELENPLAKVTHAASIVRDSGMQEGMSVLDAGCGPGRVSIPAAKQVGPLGKVLALDIQEAMLKRVQQKAEGEGLNNVYCLHAGLGEGKLGRERFDRAVLVMAIGEIPQREAALAEIYHALKPRGVLTVTEMIFDPHFQRSEKVLELAEAVGFQKQALFGGRFAYSLNLIKDENH